MSPKNKQSLPELIEVVKEKSVSYVGELFSIPEVSAISQANPLSSMISAYFGGKYTQEQYESLTTFMHSLHARLIKVEEDKIDKEFFNTREGKRIIGKIFKGITRDNRIEKIEAMANLTVSLYVKSKLHIDEKEVYVDILDSLNSLQLSILENAVHEIRFRKGNKHRGFGWEIMATKYKQKGISSALLLQSIRALESNGLVNQNTATIQEKDRTHYVTIFGEQLYTFINEPVEKNTYL